jgi:hypothetical protein
MPYYPTTRYCPGDAGGSPGLMSRDEADALLACGTRLIRLLQGVGGMDKNAVLPHIGGYCAKCRPPHPYPSPQDGGRP